MMTPTASPIITDSERFTQLLISSSHRMTNVAATISAELKFVPTDSDFSNSFMPASSRVRTAKIPMMESKIPTAAISIGAITALNCISVSPVPIKAAAPSAAVASIDPQYDSYRSAPMPATSPTLSPTLSAIVAGLRGSSSGIPASTLPTRSAPTSAAFV